MTIRIFPRPPILAATLILPLLIPTLIHTTTESLALQPAPSRRRLFRIGLRATTTTTTGDDDDDDDNGDDDDDVRGRGGRGAFDPLERIVRTVTRNEGYKFGDITKSVVGATTQGVEGTVRSVTRNKEYQFGDLTKKVVGATTHGVEDMVKSATGNEEYKFGDLTRGTLSVAGNVMTLSEKSLKSLRDNDVHELIGLLNIFWTKNMGDRERTEAFTVAVYLGAIMVLAYNFVANVMSGMVFAASWSKICMEAGSSPLSPGNWPKFLEAKSAMDIFFGGPCLPARAIITIPWFFRYRKFVVGVARNLPLRGKFPIINKYASLILSWLVANLAFVGGITLLMMKMGSLMTGVPVFSVV